MTIINLYFSACKTAMQEQVDNTQCLSFQVCHILRCAQRRYPDSSQISHRAPVNLTLGSISVRAVLSTGATAARDPVSPRWSVWRVRCPSFLSLCVTGSSRYRLASLFCFVFQSRCSQVVHGDGKPQSFSLCSEYTHPQPPDQTAVDLGELHTPPSRQQCCSKKLLTTLFFVVVLQY